MHSNYPAATVTTNSSHLGGDFKIHPWEPRVFSILECADLQTTPRCYDWSSVQEAGRTYSIRQVIGEAFPPYFTYLHGRLLSSALSSNRLDISHVATAADGKIGHRVTKGVRNA